MGASNVSDHRWWWSGGSFQTPALKQGNFVFGFFLDSQDRQVPVIMGVLGNNATTRLKLKLDLVDLGNRSVAAVNQNTERPAGMIFQTQDLRVKILSKSIKRWQKEQETKHLRTDKTLLHRVIIQRGR